MNLTYGCCIFDRLPVERKASSPGMFTRVVDLATPGVSLALNDVCWAALSCVRVAWFFFHHFVLTNSEMYIHNFKNEGH